MDVTALARRVLPWVDPDITVGAVTLALDHVGGESVLRVGVTDARRAADAERPADTVQTMTVALALPPLLLARLSPEDVVATGLRLHVQRGTADEADDDPTALLAHLQHLDASDVQVSVADAALGQTWHVSDGSLRLQRGADGSLSGRGAATLSIATVSATVTADGRYGADGAQLHLVVTPVSPAALAQAAPSLAALKALDAAVSLEADASFSPALAPLRAKIHAQSGPGTAAIPVQGGSSTAKFDSMALDLDATPSHAALQALRVVLPSPSGAPPTTLVLSGTADRAGGRFQAQLAIDLDHLAFADLPALWPEHVGTNARAWLTENLTAGTAHDAHIAFGLAGMENGDAVDLTSGSGALTADDVSTWWLRPVPPLEHGHAVVTWQNADTVQIGITGSKQGRLAVDNGSVRITGLTHRDQVAAIGADVTGPLGDLITLLRNPRFKLLSKHPVPIAAPSGDMTAHLTVQLPLDAKVTIDQVVIHGNGQVANTHLGAIAAGRDLDHAQLAFDVTNDGLSVNGPGQFDHMPGKFAVDMDFRAGPPAQLVQHAVVSLRVGEQDARAAGLGAIGLQAGTMTTSLDYAEHRDGSAVLRVSGDLREAAFKTPLGWSKVVGTPGHFEGQALLSNGKLVGLEGLRAEAPGLSIEARSDLVGGVPAIVHLQRGEIGRSSATGTVTLPQRDGEPYRVSLSGPRLDLEGRLNTAKAPPPSPAPPTGAGKPGTPYAVDLRFQQVVFGPGRSLGPVSLVARGDGRRLVSARLVTAGPERLQADLTPAGAERTLSATAADLGLLLHETDLATEITGGALTLDGHFDDRVASSPFIGTIDLRNFQVHGAPVVGKVLQGLTLYGLVDALGGPGLVFDRLDSPFRLDGSVLDVEDARAYSLSLGVTATGRLDFGRALLDLKGTIVPAYFFNSLPGRVPLLGRLFSPEKGGGVFAANYGLTGPLVDPKVTVNPLSALTPGFTRRLFDLFK